MSKLITIPKEAGMTDPFYRYKREYVQVEHTGRRGGRTRITNIASIAKSIQQPETFIRKYLQKVMGTSVSKDFSLPGYLSPETLDAVIETLITEYVLCPTCGNPETAGGRCAACGNEV